MLSGSVKIYFIVLLSKDTSSLACLKELADAHRTLQSLHKHFSFLSAAFVNEMERTDIIYRLKDQTLLFLFVL